MTKTSFRTMPAAARAHPENPPFLANLSFGMDRRLSIKHAQLTTLRDSKFYEEED